MKADCANSNAFLWLGGCWTFSRRISNGLTATGRAVFLASELPAGGTVRLDYSEDGTLSTGGRFTKRYRYGLTDSGIVVVHADGQNDGEPFQTLRFRQAAGDSAYALQASASNLCGQDRYQSTYRLGADRFWTHHVVSGPRKAYEITTAFKRAPRPVAGRAD